MARVLVCDRVSQSGVEILRSVAEVVEAGSPGEDELIGLLQGCSALLVRSATKATARVIAGAPELRVIARAGVGVDNIDVAAASHYGVLVVNSPAGNVLAAAEHTVAMLLSAARNIPQAAASMKAGQFDRKSFMGRQVSGKVLGIVGLGRIGSEVARRARGLGMEIIVFDPYAPEDALTRLGARAGDLDEVLAQADFVTVHTPLTNETRGLIGATHLAGMKPTAILVNCARGGIVDEDDLLAALQEGTIAGAALDVFANEPDVNADLVSHPAVIATPHLGASTSEAQETVAVDVANQVVDVLSGRPPSSPVNVPAVSPELAAEIEGELRLAGHLSALARALVTGALKRVWVKSSSSVPAEGLPILARRLMAGALAGHVDQPLNDVNALAVAAERGIEVGHSVTADDHGYRRYLEINLEWGDRTALVAGAVLDGAQSRILRVDGFSVDMAPQGHTLLVWRRNPHVPGIIGGLGTTLGNAGVPINSIQVGREQIDGVGLLAVALGQPIPAEIRDAIGDTPDVVRLEVVCFL